MTKKKRDQFEMPLSGKAEERRSLRGESGTNIVDVRQFKIKNHTQKVMDKLRENGLVRPKGGK